jgi:hypothetical protein
MNESGEGKPIQPVSSEEETSSKKKAERVPIEVEALVVQADASRIQRRDFQASFILPRRPEKTD